MPGVVGTAFKETLEEDGGRLELHGRITRFGKNGFYIESRIHAFEVGYFLEEKTAGPSSPFGRTCVGKFR
jgi:hypothetical protein